MRPATRLPIPGAMPQIPFGFGSLLFDKIENLF
jgi:hypothetical protein